MAKRTTKYARRSDYKGEMHRKEYLKQYRIDNPKKSKTSEWLDAKLGRREEYRQKQRERRREKKLADPNCFKADDLKKYGLAVEDFNELFVEQDGKCAICGIHQSELKQSLGIDHCHKTNKIRGLLCNKCNRGIGYLGDDVENLRMAILYLVSERKTG